MMVQDILDLMKVFKVMVPTLLEILRISPLDTDLRVDFNITQVVIDHLGLLLEVVHQGSGLELTPLTLQQSRPPHRAISSVIVNMIRCCT